LKIKPCAGIIRNVMVINMLSTSGVKCQVGDFSVLVDTPPGRKGNLILETKTRMPVDSFGSQDVIQGPGEYEIGGVRVRGAAIAKESSPSEIKTAYGVELDGIKLGFLGSIETVLEDDVLDALGEIDILFFSADIKKLKAKQITTLIKQTTPIVIVPTDEKLVKLLAVELGQKVKAMDKLVVKKKDILKEGAANKLVWLKIS